MLKKMYFNFGDKFCCVQKNLCLKLRLSKNYWIYFFRISLIHLVIYLEPLIEIFLIYAKSDPDTSYSIVESFKFD